MDKATLNSKSLESISSIEQIVQSLNDYSRQHNLVICDIASDTVTVAAEQINVEQQQVLEQLSQRAVKVMMLSKQEMEIQQQFSHNNRYSNSEDYDNASSFEQLVVMDTVDTQNYNINKPVIDYLQWLFSYAFRCGASDIHFEPVRKQGIIRMRIDGLLRRMYSVPLSTFTILINRIKILGRMDISEKRRPQDGRIKTTVSDNNIEVELRLATLMTAFGEKLVVRMFCPDVLQKSFQAMGFNQQLEQHWTQLLQKTGGILLVVGPTGSGKTTTLYNSLSFINCEQINICTVEDPIEMVVADYNQTQVQTSIDVTFPTAIRALLRQDPDVIMVGEIRDTETADMAMRAALTGHLVLSTLHADSALQSVTRLIDIGVPEYLIKSCLLGVLSQRLIRLLCEHCKKREHNYYRSTQGCSQCNYTGYKGRQGVYELLSFTDIDNKSSNVIKLLHQNPDKFIIQSMSESIDDFLNSGVTSSDEILRVFGVRGC